MLLILVSFSLGLMSSSLGNDTLKIQWCGTTWSEFYPVSAQSGGFLLAPWQ